MNYITLIILLSLSTYTFCTKSNPSQDDNSSQGHYEEDVDEEEGKEDMLVAVYVYQKLKFTFDVDNNPDALTQQDSNSLPFEFEDFTEEDDWKVVAKIKGHFIYADQTDLPVQFTFMKFGAIDNSQTVDESQKNDYMVLSTTEIRTVKTPYQAFLTCADCQEVLETIGDANDGLHITEQGVTYDSIGSAVHDNGDGTFTLSLNILLNNDEDIGSEVTSMYNDDEDEMEEIKSMSSEIDMDIDNSLQIMLKTNFAQKITEAEKMNDPSKQNVSHKFLV